MTAQVGKEVLATKWAHKKFATQLYNITYLGKKKLIMNDKPLVDSLSPS